MKIPFIANDPRIMLLFGVQTSLDSLSGSLDYEY
jgi:hypothetical protein